MSYFVRRTTPRPIFWFEPVSTAWLKMALAISKEMEDVPVQAVHRIEVRDKLGNPSQATLEIRYRRLRGLPPIGKKKRYAELSLTVVYAQERGAPQGRDPIDWKRLTDLPVNSKTQAIEN